MFKHVKDMCEKIGFLSIIWWWWMRWRVPWSIRDLNVLWFHNAIPFVGHVYYSQDKNISLWRHKSHRFLITYTATWIKLKHKVFKLHMFYFISLHLITYWPLDKHTQVYHLWHQCKTNQWCAKTFQGVFNH